MPPTLVRYWASYLKSERHGARIAAYFARTAAEGWRQILVCEREPDQAAWAAPLRSLGVETTFLPRARGNFDPRCVAATLALCRRERPDIFHCDNTHTSPLLGAWLAGVKVRLWTKHAMEPASETGSPPGLRDRVAISLRVSTSLATRTLPISEAMRQELIDKGIPASRLQLLHLPVEAPSAVRPLRADARARLGYAADHFVILTIGRAAPVKGWDILLRAFDIVHRQNPAARLLLVGGVDAADERELYADLQRLAAERGLDPFVRFTGRLADVSDPLSAADLFVLPSRSDGFALALVEALRAGLPCMASSSVAGALELIVNGRNGLIFPREDAATLARMILDLAADPALRTALAAAAPDVAVPTLAEHSEALYRLYTSLLHATHSRGSTATPASSAP
jgi:glycosyltransferase involved in cell wall biosynthesis